MNEKELIKMIEVLEAQQRGVDKDIRYRFEKRQLGGEAS